QDVYPEDYLNYHKNIQRTLQGKSLSEEEKIELQRIKEIANAYKTYQKILLENNALDFGDLINYCLKLFKTRPKILQKFRERFKYILVDEFQDTNWAQYELVKLLAQPLRNITVTGDDDQAIYRWRGASFNNVIRFKEDYPNAKEIVLVKNYRSSQNILDLAYKFIQLNNPNRLEYQLNQEKEILKEAKRKGVFLQSFKKISKRLIAQTDEVGIIEYLHFRSLEEEVRGVVDKIEELLEEGKAQSFSDFAILVRSNDAAKPFENELARRNLPYQFLASRGLYSQPTILDVISYFKLLDNYHESSAVFRVLTSPIVDLPSNDIAKITNFAKRKTLFLYEALVRISEIEEIKKKTKEKVVSFLKMVEEHKKFAKTHTTSSLFLQFLNDSGYLKYLVQNNKTKEIDLLNQFYKKIKQFEETQIERDVSSFVEALNLEIEAGETGKLEFDIQTGPEMIKIMTIHSAKGLEFPYVFLVNLVNKRFPTIERKDPIEIPKDLIKDILPVGDVHLQEERRLFYVGMTRAKKGLFFTSADDYGGQKTKKPSRFLYELGIIKDKKEVEQKTLFEIPKVYVSKKQREENLPLYFSYTQLAAFEKCPLQYKFAFILKIPRAGSATLSFGKTMHNTLFKFVKDSLSNPKLSLKNLLKIYEKEWIDEWYQSKNQKERYYQLGRDSLKTFFLKFKEKNPKIKIIAKKPALELNFNFKLKSYTIKGQIDRIDELKDKEVEIIDYKTGKAKEKLSKEDKEQLLIYQIATEEVLGLRPYQLTYYYLDEGEEVSFHPEKNEKKIFKERLIETIEKIKKSKFEPTPGFHCRFCDYKHICEFRQFS
ncbi:MAG: PD-(D/E)XK nuclease family protein, partial [Candidatus Pacebacteria bacterium]|nr:PD-(D/E)XK nuclease family protein [Candidatus Paceibacterota bacterium]